VPEPDLQEFGPVGAEHGLTLHGEPARFERGWRKLGEGTWAWLQPNGQLGESNAGLVAGDGEALLVDTLWDLKLTGAMLAEARGLGAPEPGFVFNTHSDGDHVWGNQLLAGAQIVSTDAARRLMTLDTPKEMRRLQKLGAVMPGMARQLRRFDWSEVELTLPGETFEGKLTLDVGGREVELIEVGPAHTIGDAVAWVPDVWVCFAADVLFIGCTPITWAGPVSAWLEALERIGALGATTYVPGHGPPCGQDEVDELREYLEWVRDEGTPLLERGVAPAKAAARMLLSGEFAAAPWAAWDDPERLVVTLSTERFRRDGGEGHLTGAGRMRAVLQMQRVGAKLRRHRSAR
jgi:glyoxylase-like metal-dependent hydrolase (beta-lactamase superfamily II)